MAVLDYTFRLQEAQWDFGGAVGIQYTMCFHQYVDADGYAIDPDSDTGGAGAWEPFIPGPVIRGKVGDIVRVRIQNRMSDPNGNFVKALKKETTVHWHGVEVANAYDGTPVTQVPIPSGKDFVYKFKLIRPGVFWYHPHWDSMIQTLLGGYGPIVVEDDITDELRTLKIIPHADRTFNITLSDLSFQNDREEENMDSYVPATQIPLTPPPIYIRNIHHIPGAGDQNFGDAYMINGKYWIPFNDTNANYQQFWYKGERTTAGPIWANIDESFAFQLINSGLHRFYKVHLAYRTSLSDPTWTRSDNLFRLGGEGGLLDEARAGGGEFGDFRIRGYKGRMLGGGLDEKGTGLNSIQTDSELTAGEFLLSESSRIIVAFAIDPTWKQVALRVNGFSVVSSPNVAADQAPEGMPIAIFSVGVTTSDTYKLPSNITAGTQLRTNPALSEPSPLEDLSSFTPIVTSFAACSQTELDVNGVILPPGNIMTDYNLDLVQIPGSGPGIDDFQAFWTNQGPGQPTFENTRYVQKGDVVEWTVESGTPNTDHPWHLHGFSFQPIKIELNDGNDNYTLLYTWDFVEYVDSIYVPFAHKLTFRFKVEDRPFVIYDNIEQPNGVIGAVAGPLSYL